MNPQRKRLLVYAIIILFGFVLAYLFLPGKNSKEEIAETIVPLKKDSLINASLLSEFFDMESNNEAFISSEKFSSGNKSCKLSPSMEYGFSINKSMSDIPFYENLKTISVNFKYFTTDDPNALYVLAINDAEGKNVFWDGKPFVPGILNNWTDAAVDFLIAPELLKPGYTLSIYPWNRAKKTFYIDDVRIDFNGTVVYKPVAIARAGSSNLFFDFEDNNGMSGTDAIKETTSHSGKRACDLSGRTEYGPTVSKKISTITSGALKKISMSIWVYPLTDEPNTVLTASIVNSKNETVFWDGKSTENKPFPKNQWTKLNASYFLPYEKISPDDLLNVNIWNKGKKAVIVDDLEIVYGESPERRGNESVMDAAAIYEKRFVAENNKPPFQTIWFIKQEIKNNNSTSITPPDKKNIIDNFSPNDHFLIGDFVPDKNNLDEILCVKAWMQGLFAYSPEQKQFVELWHSTNSADSIFNENNSYYAVNFNNDGKMDILLVDKKNRNWGVITFEGKRGKEWTILAGGTEKNLDKKWIAKSPSPNSSLFSAKDEVFAGSFSADKQQHLRLNHDWRFDLKLIEDNTILGNVDFKGYPEDHNPKYYEFIKLVPGKFLSKDRSSVLVIMSNCEDINFDGKQCEEEEELKHLPSSTQVYTAEIHHR